MWRVRATWQGGNIGTGFTNLFFEGGVSTAQAAADAARAFFNTAYGSGGMLPSGISITFDPTVTDINVETGLMGGEESVTTPLAVTGGDSTVYAAVAGACVTWVTNGFVGGKRVRGRTFLVPVGGQGLQTNGTLGTTFLTGLATACNNLIAAAPSFSVWHRPASVAAGGGQLFQVLQAKVADKTAYLTSRR